MRGEMMKQLRKTRTIFLAGSLLGMILWGPVIGYCQDQGSNSKNRLPEGVYIKLTKDFYEALKNEGSSGAKIYTNNPSNEYLKQIAISSKYMVETNLRILEQQEKMNQLLQSLLKGKRK